MGKFIYVEPYLTGDGREGHRWPVAKLILTEWRGLDREVSFVAGAEFHPEEETPWTNYRIFQTSKKDINDIVTRAGFVGKIVLGNSKLRGFARKLFMLFSTNYLDGNAMANRFAQDLVEMIEALQLGPTDCVYFASITTAHVEQVQKFVSEKGDVRPFSFVSCGQIFLTLGIRDIIGKTLRQGVIISA